MFNYKAKTFVIALEGILRLTVKVLYIYNNTIKNFDLILNLKCGIWQTETDCEVHLLLFHKYVISYEYFSQ